ncbi:MAG: sensor histidine kinase [Spirochaetia bacterium]
MTVLSAQSREDEVLEGEQRLSTGPARDLRERMLTRLLQVVAIVGIIAYLPSAYLSIKQHVWLVLAVDTAAFLYAICLAIFKQLPFRLRLLSLIFIAYVLGVVLIIFTGPFGAGHLFIFAFVFLVSLFGGIREIVLANALAILTHVGFTAASALHLVPWPQGPESVVVISANFILVSLILSYSANYLLRGYASSASEEKRLREALEMMLREIEHRVKNNLQVISSLVSLRGGPGDDPARALQDIKETISAISVVHQLLYRRSAFYLVELNALLDSLTQRFRSLDRRIDFSLEWNGAKAEIDGDRAISIGLLINEIVMNSMKHAFPHREEGRVSVKVDFDAGNRTMELSIGDDGSGMAEEAAVKEKNGMKIIRALARQLDANMEMTRAPGVTYRFRMKIDQPEAQLAGAQA